MDSSIRSFRTLIYPPESIEFKKVEKLRDAITFCLREATGNPTVVSKHLIYYNEIPLTPEYYDKSNHLIMIGKDRIVDYYYDYDHGDHFNSIVHTDIYKFLLSIIPPRRKLASIFASHEIKSVNQLLFGQHSVCKLYPEVILRGEWIRFEDERFIFTFDSFTRCLDHRSDSYRFRLHVHDDRIFSLYASHKISGDQLEVHLFFDNSYRNACIQKWTFWRSSHFPQPVPSFSIERWRKVRG